MSTSGPADSIPENHLPIIFVGPSLPRSDVMALLGFEADIRPPIRRGDLEDLPPGVRLIGIIDGVFQADLAVSPREVLKTLQRGVAVLGSSSMGALRAAELDVFGMIGVGEVYRMFHDGEIDSDAEVALVFHPGTLESLSEPLVNIRYALKQAVAQAELGPEDAAAFLNIARETFFPELNYPTLSRRSAGQVSADGLSRFRSFVAAQENRLDIKRIDAIVLLRHMNDLMGTI